MVSLKWEEERGKWGDNVGCGQVLQIRPVEVNEGGGDLPGHQTGLNFICPHPLIRGGANMVDDTGLACEMSDMVGHTGDVVGSVHEMGDVACHRRFCAQNR